MRHKRIYLAALAHSFGSGQQPVRSACMRLGGLFAAGAAISYLFGLSVQGLPLRAVPHAYLLLFVTAFTVQVATCFALLVSLGMMRSGQTETFAKLLLAWPLTKTTRWLLCMLPNFILAGLAALLVAWPLYLILSTLGLALPLFFLAVALGLISGFGLIQGLPIRLHVALVVWVPGIVWVEYLLLQRINDSALSLDARVWPAAALTALLTFLCGLFVITSRRVRPLITAVRYGSQRRSRLPIQWWFLVKMLRRTNVRISFGVAMLMGIGIALAGQRGGLHDPEAYSLLAALLAASFATDIRALARRFNPAEIATLRGVQRFSTTYLWWTILGSLVAAAPLVATLFASSDTLPPAYGAHLYLQVLIGILVGALAGSVIIPEGRDITGQCMSTLLVLGMLFALPQLPFVDSLSMAKRTILDVACCLLLAISIFGIEQKRNPYSWRKIHA